MARGTAPLRSGSASGLSGAERQSAALQLFQSLRHCFALIPLGLVELDLEVDLLTEDRDVSWSRNPDTNLFAHHSQDRHLDVVPDHDALVAFSGEDEHGRVPPCRYAAVPCSSHTRNGPGKRLLARS